MILFFILVAEPVEDSIFYSYSHFPHLQKLVAGYSFGQLGWCIGATLGNWIGETTDATSIAGYSLYGLGASFGVWWIGNQYFDGNYFHTLLGTALFPSILLLLRESLPIKQGSSTHQNINDAIHFSLPIGSFIGYNLFRKKPIYMDTD